ncbi:hypothetical protein [Nocardioides renjunii]|uniref:hypothetical protein n=1 Tax=Nocardioides renjunii TaxID=3095075 RepID=UPI002AFFA662|nr:hypothetical protein [Nocardioides sp. S-34]WQQ23562.1 hypothetical protein SHK17_06140 [Nocardioides sp. S-34]
MNPLGKVTAAITHPARTVGAVAGATVGASVGVATAGLRTTARVVGWAVERAAGTVAEHGASSVPAPRPAQDTLTAEEPTSAATSSGTSDVSPEAPAMASAEKAPAERAAAKKAPATKAPAKKAAAAKAPAKKAAAKKAPAKKAPSKQAAVLAPALGLTEDEVADGVGVETTDDLRTPSGIPAADEGYNPDTTETDLYQPGTEPLVDPATVKAVASEAEVLGRAADPDKG